MKKKMKIKSVDYDCTGLKLRSMRLRVRGESFKEMWELKLLKSSIGPLMVKLLK